MEAPKHAHSALVVVEIPDVRDPQVYMRWEGFVNTLPSTPKKAVKAQALADNVCLIPLQSDLAFFAGLLFLAGKMELSYRVHFYLEEPGWSYG